MPPIVFKSPVPRLVKDQKKVFLSGPVQLFEVHIRTLVDQSRSWSIALGVKDQTRPDFQTLATKAVILSKVSRKTIPPQPTDNNNL